MTYSQWMQQMRHNEQTGRGVVFAIDYHEHIVGQISLGAIDLGSMRTGVIGYWVDQRYAGHGFAPMAVALLADWAFCDPTGPRLHRMEIALLPENERIPMDVKVGDKVLYSKYGGTEVHYEGEDYLIVSSRDVLAILG